MSNFVDQSLKMIADNSDKIDKDGMGMLLAFLMGYSAGEAEKESV